MKSCLLLFLISFSMSSSLHSQSVDSLRYKYTNQTIYRYGGTYKKGTERLSFQQLRNEFSMSDLGLAAYDKAKKYKTTCTILRVLSLGAGIASIVIIANNGNRNTGAILLGGQIVLAFGAGRYSMLSNQSLDQALWQRNKDLLFPAR